MASVGGFEIPINFPKLGIGGAGIWFGIALIVLVLIIGIVAIFLMYRYRLYRYKIIVFENVSGQGFQIVMRDRARLVKLGDGGEEILFLLKKKVYRSAYGRKMGKNTYWYAIGQDGYWYNCVLGDIDAKMGMLDIEPIDRDMRYMHVAIRKNIQDRYRKQNFMDKYGTYVMSGIFLIIMILGIWFILDKIADIATSVAQSVAASEKVSDASEKILSSLDNLCSSSGFKEVT